MTGSKKRKAWSAQEKLRIVLADLHRINRQVSKGRRKVR